MQPASLEQYLRNGIECAGIIDYQLRASIAYDGRVVFYIHPDSKDGDTADFEVCGNQLKRNRDVTDSPT